MRWLSLLTLLAALSLVACSGGARPLTPQEQELWYESRDFHIKPPQGGAWRLTRQGPALVEFAEERRTFTRTLYASADSLDVGQPFASQDEFLAAMRRSHSRGSTTTGRFFKLAYEEALDSRFGPYCTRFRSEVEDLGAPNRGTAPFLLGSV